MFGAVMRKSGLKLLSSALPTLLLLAAGCGAMSSPGGSSGLVITAEKASIDTTATDQLTARVASGGPASVKWTIAAGQNDPSLGQGTIIPSGAYSPPALLS